MSYHTSLFSPSFLAGFRPSWKSVFSKLQAKKRSPSCFVPQKNGKANQQKHLASFFPTHPKKKRKKAAQLPPFLFPFQRHQILPPNLLLLEASADLLRRAPLEAAVQPAAQAAAQLNASTGGLRRKKTTEKRRKRKKNEKNNCFIIEVGCFVVFICFWDELEMFWMPKAV